MTKIARRTFSVLLPGAAANVLFAESAPLNAELVKDWIVKAHRRKLDPMKELLAREPALLQSSWDWGAGDFENAMQAAAHTGSREMALFLIDRGARSDLFAIAMLGELSVLKITFDKFPAALQVRGAHGIPLLSHAVVGEAPALPVVEYLLARGVDVNAASNNGSTALMAAASTGQRDTVRLLLSRGADARTKAKNGGTALSVSLTAGHTGIAADLKDAGATE